MPESTKSDVSRVKRVLERAGRGEPITLAFIGGSITQGSAASYGNAYPDVTARWWREAFPTAEINVVNAGVGATTSQFGVCRAQADVLSCRPDLIVVEFSVNDEPTPFFEETYEGLIRKLLSDPSAPAVVIFSMARFDTGENAREAHDKIALRYGVPRVSVRDKLYPRVASGEMNAADLSADMLHPNDRGHALCAALLTDFFGEARASGASPEREADRTLPAPVTPNRFEKGNAKRVEILMEQKAARNVLTIKGRPYGLALQYIKSPKGGMAKAEITVKNAKGEPIFVKTADAAFPDGWGDWFFTENLFEAAQAAEPPSPPEDLTVETETTTDGRFEITALMGVFDEAPIN